MYQGYSGVQAFFFAKINNDFYMKAGFIKYK